MPAFAAVWYVGISVQRIFYLTVGITRYCIRRRAKFARLKLNLYTDSQRLKNEIKMK